MAEASTKKQVGYGAAGYVAGSSAGAAAAVGPKKYGQAYKNIGTALRQNNSALARGSAGLSNGTMKRVLYGSTKVANRAAKGGWAGGLTAAAGGVALARRKKGPVKKSGHSAFGIDHGEIAKYDRKKYGSPGRLAAGGLAPGFHGAAAGKPGDKRKLKAAGAELGGSMIGGGTVGGAAGTAYANSQGWYKKQPANKLKSKKVNI